VRVYGTSEYSLTRSLGLYFLAPGRKGLPIRELSLILEKQTIGLLSGCGNRGKRSSKKGRRWTSPSSFRVLSRERSKERVIIGETGKNEKRGGGKKKTYGVIRKCTQNTKVKIPVSSTGG